MARRSLQLSRRSFASGLAAALAGGLAGCTSNQSDGGGGGTTTTTTAETTTTTTTTASKEADLTIAVGPNGSLRFEPERVGIQKGDTVEFHFDSGGHNVSAIPEHSSEVHLPEGAEPFASYSGDNKYSTDPAGTSYYHTFQTKGEYTYVCIPHVSAGMIGHITVR